MNPIEQKHPFFQPLWRRVAIVLLVAAWLAYEVFYTHDSLWITVAAGMLAYGIWTFFVNWSKTP